MQPQGESLKDGSKDTSETENARNANRREPIDDLIPPLMDPGWRVDSWDKVLPEWSEVQIRGEEPQEKISARRRARGCCWSCTWVQTGQAALKQLLISVRHACIQGV